jgi:Flp pilus assembly protein TadD
VLRRQGGRDEEAEGIFRRGVELGDDVAAVNLAALLRDHDRSEEAEALLRKTADDGSYAAAEELARTLYDAGRYDESERSFRQASEDPAGRPEAMTCVGVLLEARGEAEEALRWMRRGAEGGDPNAREWLTRRDR